MNIATVPRHACGKFRGLAGGAGGACGCVICALVAAGLSKEEARLHLINVQAGRLTPDDSSGIFVVESPSK